MIENFHTNSWKLSRDEKKWFFFTFLYVFNYLQCYINKKMIWVPHFQIFCFMQAKALQFATSMLNNWLILDIGSFWALISSIRGLALFIGMGGYNFGVGLTRKNHDPPVAWEKKSWPPCSRKTYTHSRMRKCEYDIMLIQYCKWCFTVQYIHREQTIMWSWWSSLKQWEDGISYKIQHS